MILPLSTQSPCQPRLVDRPPAGPDWRHEVKHDGYRIVARKQGEQVTLWSRHGTSFTDRLPRIAESVRGLAVEHALLDGEAVVFRPDGLSDFGALRTKAGGARACLVAFDLLNLDGEDLRQHPLEERRGALLRLVDGADGILCSARRSRPRARSCSPRPASWAWRGSCRSAPAVGIGAGRAGSG